MVVSVFKIEHKVGQEYWFLEVLEITLWRIWNLSCPLWLDRKRRMGMWSIKVVTVTGKNTVLY